jgi:ABC-type Fe3+ transport system substrate-binding protein
MQRIKAEGENATADLLLTVDAGNLWQAEQMGILQPFTSKIIDANIPAQYRARPPCLDLRACGPSPTPPSGSRAN